MRGDGRILNKKHSRFPSVAYYRDGKEIRESAAPAIREAEAKKGRTLSDAEANHVARRVLKIRVRAVANDREGIQAFIGPAQERIKVSELLNDLVSRYRLDGKKGIPREPDPPMRSHLKCLYDRLGEIPAAAFTQRKAKILSRNSGGRKRATQPSTA